MNTVSYGPCALCRRDCDEMSVNVDFQGVIVTVCDNCWSKRDEDYLDERLDYSEAT